MTRKTKSEGPQFVRYFGPLLDALRALGDSGTPDEVVERIACDLALTDEIQNEVLPSEQSRYRNQVAWARYYLVRMGLLDSSKRGVWTLTEKGRTTSLSLDQAREIANQVRIYQKQQRAKTDTSESVAEQVVEDAKTAPETYRGEVFDLLLKLPSGGFEHLSQRLLREAGFIQVVVTGRSGDGGIDGYGHTLTHNSFSINRSHELHPADEVAESGEAQPEGLDAGFAVAFAAEEAAEHGDLPDHLAELGRGVGWNFLCQEIRALPFLLAEQLAGRQVRMSTPQSHEVCQAPRHHHVNRQGQLDLVDMPQLQGFYPTAILEDMEKYFNFPPRAIPVDQFCDRFKAFGLAIGHQAPFNGLDAVRCPILAT